jgi:hypothetical protein
MLLRQLFFPNKPWLFKKQIQDDTFGRMWFNSNKKEPQFNHYQGHFTFKPINKEVDIFFDSDREGISNDQKNVFNTLENNYNDYISILINAIRDYILNKKSRNLDIKDFNAEFKLFGISIPRIENGYQDVKLYYESDTHRINNISVTFRNGELLKVN